MSGGSGQELVASTFASSFDKSTEDEKATVDKRDSGMERTGSRITA